MKLRIGIDIGGTFTDFIIFNPDTKVLNSLKVPSTPEAPSGAVLQGLRRILVDYPEARLIEIIHGSTVATNALLEKKGARTALITTRGFGDVLEIGRQQREELYNLTPVRSPVLVPKNLRYELDERVDSTGEILRLLAENSAIELEESLRSAGVESIAICFLFSFLRPDHEILVAETLRAAGWFVSASHEILPEYREYERMSTTVVNAYVAPIMDRYLSQLSNDLESLSSFSAAPEAQMDTAATNFSAKSGKARRFVLQIMQSNGGIISPKKAQEESVRCILSGPAGGLVGAAQLSAILKSEQGHSGTEKTTRVLTFDMGGTSTDVSLILGGPRVTTESVVGGLPIGVPVLDIHTIGAGGGSIAYIDLGGGLRVGPESAGADPGPACYGRGEPAAPTVTDANLLLGRLLPDHFLGGEMSLYPDRAASAIEPLGKQLGISTIETALGIVQIANAHMTRALQVISVERGHDPAQFQLVSFGGAGGLHAAELARSLGIPRVIIPAHASTFSALGMLQADIVKDYTRTVMLTKAEEFLGLSDRFKPMVAGSIRDLRMEGVADQQIHHERFIDVRFRGQSYELRIPFTARWRETFLAMYREQYGYLPPGIDLEIVNLRVRARGEIPQPEIAPLPLDIHTSLDNSLPDREIYFAGGWKTTPVYRETALKRDQNITGPAIVIRPDTTILVPPGDQIQRDRFGNLIFKIMQEVI